MKCYIAPHSISQEPFCVIFISNLSNSRGKLNVTTSNVLLFEWHCVCNTSIFNNWRHLSAFSRHCHPGNYPRPSSYGGNASTSYSGPSITNSLGMNASSPMHGQGPGQPLPAGRSHGPGSQNRVYLPMAPSSPSMPQTAGPGMGPPSLGSSNRKAHETAAAAMPGSASTHNR